VQENVPREHVVARAAPHVVYAQLKFLWAQGAQERAHSISALLQFTDNLSRDLAGRTERQPSHALPSAKMQELSVLLSKCYLKLGEWQVEVGDDWGRVCSL
jgi:FKBP12-rapamycin complex-associated protein